MMAQLMSDRFSYRMPTCRDSHQRAELSVAQSEHQKRRCYVTNSFGQQRADLEGETAQHTLTVIWATGTGHGEQTWPTILGPLHELVNRLPEASSRPSLSDTFICAYAADRRALTGVGESIGQRVEDFGPRS